MNLDKITAAYGHQNAKAWLRLIRERESNQNDDAYRIINGGSHFDAPPWVHPYAGQSAPPGRAAGAFQYIPHTWQRVAEALGFGDDFRPLHQDLGALYLTAGRGALDDVLGDDVASACIKCRPEWISLPGAAVFKHWGGEWTSLPGAAESSASWTMEKAIAVFKHWGGTVAGEQPAAPLEEATPGAAVAPQQGKSMGAGLILGLVQTALQAFAPLAQQKITGELARHTDADTATAVAQNVMDAIQKATGKADPIEAVVALKSAPQGSTVVQAAQDDALARLDRMAPVFDKLAQYQAQEWKASDDSMDRAAERSPTGYDMTKPLVYAALGAGGIILLALMTALITYAVQGKVLPEMLLTLIVQTVTGFLGFIALLFAFRFGSSRSSAAKDEVVAQLSKQRG